VTALARRGVWTPWAEVLCLPCDYARRPPETTTERWPTRKRAADPEALLPSGYGEEDAAIIAEPSVCDGCSAPCWVRCDVAALQALRYALADMTWTDDTIPGAVMNQTGGMCCALTLTVAGHEIVATEGMAADGLYVGVYPEGCDWDPGYMVAESEPLTFVEAARWIVAQVKALQEVTP